MARFIASYSRGPCPTTAPTPSTSRPTAGTRVGASEPTQEQIERRAYELWQQAGFPSGKDEELAHQAERELRGGEMPDPSQMPER
ncbi:DUF2934 domain-containing protein [Nitrobacter sp. TKz-YC02]|uniref:DUF2934 domain-containing protein n=1 Tax=Nitrobacter sp. TKz-YC02 TaxID=3398704 RepID=UPI003CF93E48